jgi:hypothetical protein
MLDSTLREPGATSDMGLYQEQIHYVTMCSPAELRTFHCDRVRKMPPSGLDHSMLISFLSKNEKLGRPLPRVTEVCVLSFIHNPALTGDVCYSRIIR